MKNLSSVLVAICCITFLSCKKDRMANTVTDIDGNVYKTVKIGDQIWMAENLKTTRLNNGQPISYIPDFSVWKDPDNNFPMMTYYNFEYSNFIKYGVIYNYPAIETGKLAPEGWHVASKADWEKLENYLISHGFNYDGSTTGNKIAKSLASTSGWDSSPTSGDVGNNQGENNKSQFNIMSGGWLFAQDINGFNGICFQSNFWTSTSTNQTEAIATGIFYNDNTSYYFPISKRNGAYIRCVKD